MVEVMILSFGLLVPAMEPYDHVFLIRSTNLRFTIFL